MTRILRHSFVLLIFVIATVGMTWPTVFRLTSDIAGSGGDPWQTMWRFDYKLEALRQAQGVFSFAKSEFLGGGEPRLVNLSVWPWMPLHLLFGQPVAYNIIWLLSFVLSGYAMYLLVSYLLDLSGLRVTGYGLLGNAPAFLAGLYYMFLPYHAAHALGHFGAMQMQWIPLIILVALRWLKEPTARKTVMLGALLTIQAWSEHHYVLWLMILFAFAVLFWRKQIWMEFTKKFHAPNTKFQILLLLSIILIGVVLPYLPTARLAIQENSQLELGQGQLIRFSADLFSFVTPAPFHPLWGEASHALFASAFTGNEVEATQFLGFAALLLIIFFHQKIPSVQKKFWAGVVCIFGVISLGPYLHIFGTVTSIPLPYALIDSLPGISSVRAVARAGSMVGMGVAILLGFVLSTQLRRRGATIALAMILLFEFLFIPVPTQSAQLNPAYQEVMRMAGSTLIEIPAATHYTIASRALYAGTLHGKEIVGNIALERAQSEEDFTLAKSLPGIRQLLYLRTTELHEGRPEFFDQNIAETLPDAMRYAGATAIVVHKDSVSSYQLGILTAFLEEELSLVPKPYGDVTLYDITMTGRVSDGVFLIRGEGWSNVGFDANRGAVFGEIDTAAKVTLVNTTARDLQVRLHVPLANESIGSVQLQWQGHAVDAGGSITLPPGSHEVGIVVLGQGKAIIMNPSFDIVGPAL